MNSHAFWTFLSLHFLSPRLVLSAILVVTPLIFLLPTLPHHRLTDAEYYSWEFCPQCVVHVGHASRGLVDV